MSFQAPLFVYSVTPTAVPHGEEAGHEPEVSLMFCITNNTGSDVPTKQIAFVVPVGGGSSDLAAHAPFDVRAAAGVGWRAHCSDDGVVTVTPKAPLEHLRAGESVAFFAQFRVGRRAGTSVIRVWEDTEGRERQWDLLVSKRPPGLAITRFRADPIQLRPGASSDLEWTTTGASKVVLAYEGTSRSVDARGHETVKPASTTLYTLFAYAGDNATHEQLTVYVPQVAIRSFTATPVDIPRGGESILSWRLANAEKAHIRASGAVRDPGDVEPGEGSYVVQPVDTSTTYTMYATGFGNTLQDTATVDLLPSVEFFTATPSQLPRDSGPEVTSTLRWHTSDAFDISISPTVGRAAGIGQSEVKPTTTTDYVLSGKRLPHATASVVVAGVLTSLAVGSEGPYGTHYVVRWTSVGATQVTTRVDGGDWRPAPASGRLDVGHRSTVTLRVHSPGWVNEVQAWCGSGGRQADDQPAGAGIAVEPYTDVAVTCAHGISSAGADATLRFDSNSRSSALVVSGSREYPIKGYHSTLTFPISAARDDAWSVDAGNVKCSVRAVRAEADIPEADMAVGHR